MLHRGFFFFGLWRTTVLLIRELETPTVPRRIVQKLLADLRAHRIAPFERATHVREALESQLKALADSGRRWATFARFAARGHISQRPSSG
jgi:hypothetical protein